MRLGGIRRATRVGAAAAAACNSMQRIDDQIDFFKVPLFPIRFRQKKSLAGARRDRRVKLEIKLGPP